MDLRAGVLSAKGASDLATNRGLSISNRMVTGFPRVATRKAADKCQNRPDVNQRIMDVCREAGIGFHFPSIIGSWRMTRPPWVSMWTSCALVPSWSSFSVLCPIPGTEMYRDFRSRG